METTIEYWGYIGIMENKMETTRVYRCLLLGVMESSLVVFLKRGTPKRVVVKTMVPFWVP